MVDDTLISYRKNTYRKGNLLLMQNQLLERCEELIRQLDFDRLSPNEVFNSVEKICGLLKENEFYVDGLKEDSLFQKKGRNKNAFGLTG